MVVLLYKADEIWDGYRERRATGEREPSERRALAAE